MLSCHFPLGTEEKTKIIIQDSRLPGRGDDYCSLSNLSGNPLIASDYINKVEEEINCRWAMTPPEFLESSCENIVRDFVGV
jgi:hypothetical protein